ncbi:MAG: molybdopterin-dependent oxidoreductase [Methylocystis sp.]
MKNVFVFAFLLLGCNIAAAEESGSVIALAGLDGEQSLLTLTELDALPRVQLNATEHGSQHVFEGALLGDVLAKIGAPAGKAIHGRELADVVIVEARDGYIVALGLAETDSTIRNERVILADRMDGAPLAADKGPFQLVIEGDLHPARSARMVSKIRLERVR